MEIEMPSVQRERLKAFIGQLITLYTFDAGIRVLSAGSATWRQQRTQGGLEADDCYYVRHYDDVVAKKTLELAVDPPPDLAIEIDLSASSVDKQPVYARLGIPELWRFHDDEFECLHLARDGGSYVASTTSAAFPALRLQLIGTALRTREARGEAEALHEFVLAIRKR
jgi:Uma2 family endonuclease